MIHGGMVLHLFKILQIMIAQIILLGGIYVTYGWSLLLFYVSGGLLLGSFFSELDSSELDS